jgi:cytochrome c oxidase cbb3-type subunit 4
MDNIMDVNVLRSLTTLFMFLVFIGIVVWAMAGRRRADFEAAAQLPFVDSSTQVAPGAASQGEKI